MALTSKKSRLVFFWQTIWNKCASQVGSWRLARKIFETTIQKRFRVLWVSWLRYLPQFPCCFHKSQNPSIEFAMPKSAKKKLKDHHLTWLKGIISQSQLFKIQSRLRFGMPQLFCRYEILFIHRMLFQVPSSSTQVRPGHLVTSGLAMLKNNHQVCRKTSWDFDPFNSERLQGGSDTVGQALVHWCYSSRQGRANGTIVHQASTGFFQVKRCWWWKRMPKPPAATPQEDHMKWRKVLSVQALR